MSAQDVTTALEAMDDDAIAAVLKSLCPKCLDRIHAFSGGELQERDLAGGHKPHSQIPDEQLPLLAEVA